MSTRVQKLRKGVIEVQEAGDKIQLGEELQDARCLTVSEVHFFLSEKKTARASDYALARSVPASTALATNLAKFEAYCEKFNNFSNSSTVVELRKLIEEFPGLGEELLEFEIAQIANFRCETSEEMKVLVPSLHRVDDMQLQELLDHLRNLTKFAS
ncbi:hypothetical protein H9P43_000836 [Blastocladiella emersonii ATCC 22665]|nr:hypothetical protein H9P43_000836 [Blastocladiella emersonii ATCC 22665]